MSDNLANTNRTAKTLKIVMYSLLFLFVILVMYRYYGKGGIKGLTGGGDYTHTDVPEEYQINYQPADFKPNVDDETALAIMTNPHRYRREFNDLVFNVNMGILYHVANRMGLADSLKNKIQIEYQKHHPYLRNLYFNDFVQMKDTTSTLAQTWYNNEAATSVDILNEIASRYTCFLVNHVISAVVKTFDGKIAGKGTGVETPCGIAMTEGLRPLIKRMQDRAAIEDFGRSRGLMQERVEKVIAELATMEVRDKKGLNKKLQTKVLGYSVSTTDIEIVAISILKVGFKLDQYFEINLNPKSGEVTVTLPEPQILSHEVYPKVDKLDIGWMRELQNADFNRIFDALRKDFRRDAVESEIFDKSKSQAAELMNTMLSPIVTAINPRYKIKVRYRKTVTEYDEDFNDELEPQNIPASQDNTGERLNPFG